MKRPLVLIAVFAALAAAFLYMNRGGNRPRTRTAPTTLDDIKRQVAADAIKQYEIAKRNGSALDRCAAASGVKAAVLQAQDEAGYARWSKVEREDCAAATAP